MVRYVSPEEDSDRWLRFDLRPDDIVISTRSKHGTTWMQMICALLVHGPGLPAPLGELSPWLDWLIEPEGELFARLDEQPHRRIIKTHSPLDGLPLDRGAHWIVVGRHPLDAAISLYHQGDNLDRDRLAELTGAERTTPRERPDLEDWVAGWVEADPDPAEALDSLPGVAHHLTDAWARRHESNVTLVHYHALQADLEGSMRAIASAVDIVIDDGEWPGLAEAATFASMQADAANLIPDRHGVMRDPAAFFRAGRTGARLDLPPDLQRTYQARAETLFAPDLHAWLHPTPDP